VQHGPPRLGDSFRRAASGGGERDGGGPPIHAGTAADVAGGLEPVDEPHRAGRRQAKHLPEQIDRGLLEEVVQRRKSGRGREGLPPGARGTRLHPVGHREAERPQQVLRLLVAAGVLHVAAAHSKL
jgi:hypothetical protein